MGEQYKLTLEQKIKELGAENLLVYINKKGVNPDYQKHLEDTFTSAGVKFVSSREQANFIFEGHCQPSFDKGQIVAFFNNSMLNFAGAFR